MKTVYWLASYPKSGSTWVRWLLASLLNENEVTSVNALPQTYKGLGPIFSSQDRHLIDCQLGFCSVDLWPDELSILRLHALRKLVGSISTDACLFKAHELRKGGIGSEDLFFCGARHRVIQIVRDPRDVALSYANFAGVSVEDAVQWILQEDHMSPEYSEGASPALRIRLGSWRTHFFSWHMPQSADYFLVRYEDLLSGTGAVLKDIASFVGRKCTLQQALKVANRCTFEKAAATEVREGFSESMSKTRRFFRRGTAGAWQSELDAELAKRIAKEFKSELVYLNYKL